MRDIGVDVKNPTEEWDGDANCPFYGSLRLRGQVLEGTVSSLGMQKTITIERNNVRYMEKYERFEKRTSILSAHLPACIGEVSIGDTVKVMECRPLSKTVSFCVIETTGGEACCVELQDAKPVVCQPLHDCMLLTTPAQRLFKSSTFSNLETPFDVTQLAALATLQRSR